MTERRFFLDVSFLARWVGPPVGMLRVEAELAGHAGAAVTLVCFDALSGAYRPVRPEKRDALLGSRTALDPSTVLPAAARRSWRRFVPSRIPLLMALERARLGAPAPLAGLLDGMQRGLLAFRKNDFPLRTPDNARISYVRADAVLDAPVALRQGDRLFAPVADWSREEARTVAAAVGRSGAAFVPLCFDMIPVTHPKFYAPEDVARFEAVWSILLPVASRVVVNVQSVARDVAAFAARHGLSPPDVAVAPLGADRPAPPPPRVPSLPSGLEPGRFALFVSTVEPRKNHRLLIDVWRRLVARGWPQAQGVALVFVGRPGWMVDDVLADLARLHDFAGTLHFLTGVDDETLHALYRGCAFCLYPSRTEGFGLPVVEAFVRGKAVIASNGGSLPEVVGNLAPMLDPDDVEGWERLLVGWLEDPAQRAPFEARVAERLAAGTENGIRDWASAARGLMDAAGLPRA